MSPDTASPGTANTGTASPSSDSPSTANIAGVVEQVEQAVSQVCDPEYPDLTIVELGILERVWLRPNETDVPEAGAATATSRPASVVIDLIPTMLGCPALAIIESDVRAAAQAALASTPADSTTGNITADSTDTVGSTAGNITIEVRMLTEPAWTPSRISESARKFLGREYTIAVRTKSQTPPCPHCGAAELEFRSDFGPTPCRKVYWCPACRNPIEMVEGRAMAAGRALAPVSPTRDA